jgi:hypothetical protein
MLAHAVLIDEAEASRAKRPHSIELDRHSAAESMSHALRHIGRQVHSFIGIAISELIRLESVLTI